LGEVTNPGFTSADRQQPDGDRPAVRHKGFWLLAVRNPKSGFVALRATVISSSTGTSIETIYRAYGIS